MPSHHGLRPLKAWRYVGAFGPEMMLCVGLVRIGRLAQSFWAVWDRQEGRLYERTVSGRRGACLESGRVHVRAADLELDLALEESGGVETICPSAGSYAWTRKQGGVRAHGTIRLGDSAARTLDLRAVIDDTAAYYARRTQWSWSAGVGRSVDGRPVAWNLVAGVNDPPSGSERTVWVDGTASEPLPCEFRTDGVDRLRFAAEAVRERRDNLLIVRSSYRQPFGSFSGELPGGIELADGFGVMEEHEAYW
jgi:hypothetical protein